jgi:hypothetical protein
MIVVKLISGLGNQLFQYTIGRQLSIKHNVPLKLDTSFFSGQSLRSYKLDNYNIKAQIASSEDVDKLLYWEKRSGFISKVYKKAERIIPKNKRPYFKEMEWWVYDPALLTVSSNVYLDGYWQNHKYFENINRKIFDELTLIEEDAAVSAIEKNIVGNHSSVSIHIRRGDYITNTEAFNLMGVLPLSYYLKAIDLINSKLNNPSYYIFSDDLNWAKDNLKINRSVTYIDLEAGSKYDYVELDLMSKCYHNIIANSTFSWWGAFLNRNPEKIVVSPTNWVIRPEINARIQLQFPSWIKM